MLFRSGENLCHLRGGPRKNSFNNRGLISGAVVEAILPANFGAVRRGNTGQEGRIDVTIHDGILDAVGAKGPETVDGGAVELVAETVEVAHADLAGASQVAAVVATALLETGLVTAVVTPAAFGDQSHPLLAKVGTLGTE